MKVVYNRILPFGKRFTAINLFGIYFVKRPHRVSAPLLVHERIHTLQMRELGYVFFYLLYVLEWLWECIRYRGDTYRAYHEISFEREAYRHQGDSAYPQHRRCYAQWRSGNN